MQYFAFPPVVKLVEIEVDQELVEGGDNVVEALNDGGQPSIVPATEPERGQG